MTLPRQSRLEIALGAVAEAVSKQRAGITFRTIADEDRPLLFRIFIASRDVEWAAMQSVPALQRDALFQMQYQAQKEAYRVQFRDGHCALILLAGVPAGRLWLGSTGFGLHIVDITLLPQARGQGVGTTILQAIQQTAGNCPVTLRVMTGNMGAQRLYKRLGFTVESACGLSIAMHWQRRGVP